MNRHCKKLAERVKKLEAILDQLPTAVGLFDFEGRALYLNQRLCALHAVNEEWIKAGTTFAGLIEKGMFESWKKDPKAFFEHVRDTLKKDGHFEGIVDMGERIVHVRDVLLEGDLILTMQEDVTKRILAEREAQHLARHDSLTNLPNRASFNAEVERRIGTASVTRDRFGLLGLDIDRFKDINDIFGHAAGDAVLGEIARRFSECLGPSDFLARLGGDEFMLISCGHNQPEASAALAERLINSLEQPIEFEGQALKAGVSVGIAVFPGDGADESTLFKSADAALYRAKAEGRGTVRIFEPESDLRVHIQRLMLQDLRHAVQRGEIELQYQPQANVEREIYGFEALVRWRHPIRGLVAPVEFIPLAEESGLIVEIGSWVLRTACTEAARWKKPLKISVNLSPVQFRYNGLLDEIKQVLAETGLPPHRLELEITEGVLIQDALRARAILSQLKDLGVQLAMDDFGTGYSSLSYLQVFPFDSIKIDRSFISNIDNDKQAKEIIRAVIGLGKGLSIPIIAEGVETESQMAFLRDAKCENVQGYLIGKPRPIEEYSSYIAPASGQRVA